MSNSYFADRTESVLSSLDHLLPGFGDVEAESSGEKYVHLEGLGAGGMGEVVRAFDRDLQRFVAIRR